MKQFKEFSQVPIIEAKKELYGQEFDDEKYKMPVVVYYNAYDGWTINPITAYANKHKAEVVDEIKNQLYTHPIHVDDNNVDGDTIRNLIPMYYNTPKQLKDATGIDPGHSIHGVTFGVITVSKIVSIDVKAQKKTNLFVMSKDSKNPKRK